jgi:hypothetical protein
MTSNSVTLAGAGDDFNPHYCLFRGAAKDLTSVLGQTRTWVSARIASALIPTTDMSCANRVLCNLDVVRRRRGSNVRKCRRRTVARYFFSADI